MGFCHRCCIHGGLLSSAGFLWYDCMSASILFLIGILSAYAGYVDVTGCGRAGVDFGYGNRLIVLINERIREELRFGVPPRQAINLDFQHVWATIIDSTWLRWLPVSRSGIRFRPGTRFCGRTLFGYSDSMYSSVVVFRALVNLWYGRRRKLQNISIGSVWKPKAEISGGRE